jgi:hypothetical protein
MQIQMCIQRELALNQPSLDQAWIHKEFCICIAVSRVVS